MASFLDILDRPSTEIERPKPLPQGTYTCVVLGLPEHGKSSQKQTPYVRFTLRPVAAGEDVDQDALNEWMRKGDGSTRQLSEASVRADYYITEDAAWRLDKFLTDLGLERDLGSMNVRIQQCPGRQVNVFIRHEASQDGTAVFARVGDTGPVE